LVNLRIMVRRLLGLPEEEDGGRREEGGGK